ncbi:MAG: sce7726 family protein [Lachnospiraceae bacterium]
MMAEEILRKHDLLDRDMRTILFDYYEMQGKRLRIFEEFNIGRSRADAFMVSEELTGFEIKSDRDSLERLSGQIKYYNLYCDAVYLVTGVKYADRMQEYLPDFWGIYCIKQYKDKHTELVLIREAKPNPEAKLKSQLRLLWRNELIAIIKRNGLGRVSGLNKQKLVEKLLKILPFELLHKEICEELLEREYTLPLDFYG